MNDAEPEPLDTTQVRQVVMTLRELLNRANREIDRLDEYVSNEEERYGP